MTPTLSPPPARRPEPRPRWGVVKSEARSIRIGVAGTILVHVLLIWLALRWHWSTPAGGSLMTPAAEQPIFDVQLAAEPPKPAEQTTPVVPKPPPPPKFVETNPAAPDNAPDQTNNIAAKNEQAAQAVPNPTAHTDTPAVKGDKEKNSTAIVSGQLAQPSPLPVSPPSPPDVPVPQKPTPPTPPATPQEQLAMRQKIPLPGFEPAKGDLPDTTGSTVAPAAPNASGSKKTEGTPNAPRDNGFNLGGQVKVDPQHPQAHPQLAVKPLQARPAPLLYDDLGTDHTGLTGYDAKWSSYGEYLQRLCECVDSQWHKILEPSSLYPWRGSRVKVVFRLNSKGEIDEIVSVTSNGNPDAQNACTSAIVQPQPYGPWTAEMIAQLGQTQELTFEFFYE